jgi:cobalt-zinc-cadmium efflux system outer membrane protein
LIRPAFAWVLLCGAQLTIGAPTRAATPDTTGTLALTQALERTRSGHPALRASAHDVTAARARERDAARGPVPALSGGYENFGGELGSDRAEALVVLEQTLELGGDRRARLGVARAQTEVAMAERDQLGLGAEAATVELYCDAWLLQEKLAQLDVAVRSAAAAVNAAAERFRAGAAPAHEESRARAFHALREVEADRTARELSTARLRLALQWGGEAERFGALALPQASEAQPPPLDSLLAGLATHPDLRRGEAERRREDEALRLARAARVPDLTLGAGARRLAEVPGTGLVATMSMPLPMPGVGRGTEAAAVAARAAADVRKEGALARLRGDTRAAYERLASALSANRELRARTLPALEEAMRTLTAGFRAGRLGYLEIQEGQRSLLEARLLELETTADAWRARHELERLAGARTVTSAPAREDLR